MLKCTRSLNSLFWDIFDHPFLEGKHEYIFIFWHAVEVGFGFFGVVLNFAFMTVILIDRELRQEMCYYLTLFMCVSDILICVVTITTDSALFLAYYETREVRRPTLLTCRLWASFNTLACCSALLIGPVIALDKYILISKPLHYHRIMTGNTIAVLLSAVWFISFCICLVPFGLPFDKCLDKGGDGERVMLFASNQSSVVYIKLGPGEHYHPLRLCTLRVGPKEAIPVVCLAIFLPAFLLLVICFKMYKVSYVHKMALKYKFIMGKFIRSPPLGPFRTSQKDRNEKRDGKGHVPTERRSISKTFPSREKDISRPKQDSTSPKKEINSNRCSPTLDNKSQPMPSDAITHKAPHDPHHPKDHPSPSPSRASEALSYKSISDSVYRVQAYVLDKLRASFSIGLEDKAKRTLLLMVGSYFFAWVPVGILIIAKTMYLHKMEVAEIYFGQKVLKSAQCTSCLNPIIYSLTDKRLLNAIKMQFRSRSKRASVDLTAPVSYHHSTPV